MGLQSNNVQNIDVWNLRGKTVPMDKLAPKLIRRSLKKNYQAVIIDPIYKVLTGDENSADQMAHFTNQFDKVATELGCSVIYCHHHSKGAQGGKKSMDRASGSGVFARDPDALIDLVELELNDNLIKQRTDKAKCDVFKRAIQEKNLDYYQHEITLDDLQSVAQMSKHFDKALDDIMVRKPYLHEIQQVEESIKIATAWRVEGSFENLRNSHQSICGLLIQCMMWIRQVFLRIFSWKMTSRTGKKLLKKLVKVVSQLSKTLKNVIKY